MIVFGDERYIFLLLLLWKRNKLILGLNLNDLLWVLDLERYIRGVLLFFGNDEIINKL